MTYKIYKEVYKNNGGVEVICIPKMKEVENNDGGNAMLNNEFPFWHGLEACAGHGKYWLANENDSLEISYEFYRACLKEFGGPEIKRPENV